jgi:SAM-dependent methyltransferase
VKVEDGKRGGPGNAVIQGNSVSYDHDAGEYAAHRRLHAGVFREVCSRGAPGPESTVVEVGCGTGNYVRALAARNGCAAFGMDPATAMLSHAATHPCGVHWLQGRAEQFPFSPGACDLIFSVDVIHHISDRAGFCHEAARALRPGGRLCTVTDSREIILRREVLSGYFPETVGMELARYPRLAELEAWMAAAGLQDYLVVQVEEPYEVTSIQPYRDRAYSSLHLISEEAWLSGLGRLERDLACGPVRGVSRYACVWGRKPAGV